MYIWFLVQERWDCNLSLLLFRWFGTISTSAIPGTLRLDWISSLFRCAWGGEEISAVSQLPSHCVFASSQDAHFYHSWLFDGVWRLPHCGYECGKNFPTLSTVWNSRQLWFQDFPSPCSCIVNDGARSWQREIFTVVAATQPLKVLLSDRGFHSVAKHPKQKV